MLKYFIPEIIFGIVFIVGNFIVRQWRRRQDDPDILFFCAIFSLSSLFVYLAAIELLAGTFYILIPLLFLGVFLLSYFRRKARLRNGLLFNIFLVSFGIYLVFNMVQTNSLIVGGILSVGAVGLFAIVAFGFLSLLIFLYWNGVIVLRRESHSLANLLTLLLAIFLTIFLIYDSFIIQWLPTWLASLMSFLPLMMFYFFFVFYNFLTLSVLYQFNHPRYDQDFIVVLGAGLIDGERVTPLLAKRIDEAIKFYRNQAKGSGKPVKLVMSGGQGGDEKISEAQAMKNYAVTTGIPADDILMEDRSTTTLENMKFSKVLIEENSSKTPKVIFSSNNYHILRAAIYADWAHLKADGIGAPTALYYLPNAFLREYVAILMMNKRRHLMIAVLILCISILLAVLSLFQ